MHKRIVKRTRKFLKKIIIPINLILFTLMACSSSESYKVEDDTRFCKGDTQIGTFEIFENCEFASSMDEFIDVWYMSDASVVDAKEIAMEGAYILAYAELSISPSAAMEIQGESAKTEWHYYIYDGKDYFIDIVLNGKEYCTEELEEYLTSYIKKNLK